ncbi:MAG: IS66 family insertion sequence element accessory protein TnpB [Defluviicoccus sp.]|nr:IS66 family insertion sequence element accessory protein TnpB [Defluviicoccus sp.]
MWHDGVGTSLFAKRLERGRFQWPVRFRPARRSSATLCRLERRSIPK